jgi:hypothetical protein
MVLKEILHRITIWPLFSIIPRVAIFDLFFSVDKQELQYLASSFL